MNGLKDLVARLGLCSRLISDWEGSLGAGGTPTIRTRVADSVAASLVSLDRAWQAARQLAGSGEIGSGRGGGPVMDAYAVGRLSAVVMGIRPEALRALAEDPEFAYRDVAGLALQMREALDGKAKGGRA